jgi:hypothetical protein
MTTRFKNAIDALVHSFFNDTLAKGTCQACAVGNMVAYGFGKKKTSITSDAAKDGVGNHMWKVAFYTNGDTGIQKINEESFDYQAVRVCCEATGYSPLELAKVEYAFEISTKIDWIDYRNHSKEEVMQDQYNGLMAVVDVLCEIEGIEDPAEYKQLFEVPV